MRARPLIDREFSTQVEPRKQCELRRAPCGASHYHLSHKFVGAILVSSSLRAENLRAEWEETRDEKRYRVGLS